MSAQTLADSRVLAHTRRWLERAVVGLNLCPFAKSVYAKEQVHYVVYNGVDEAEFLALLRGQLAELAASDPQQRDTTLLIAPVLCPEFLDFNAMLARAQRVLRKSRLEGVLQIASFHPGYVFADAAPEDMANYTNRAPFPMLHLLREESVSRAVTAYPQAQEIYGRNIATLRALGPLGWQALECGPLA
jgi:hypothetical protein